MRKPWRQVELIRNVLGHDESLRRISQLATFTTMYLVFTTGSFLQQWGMSSGTFHAIAGSNQQRLAHEMPI